MDPADDVRGVSKSDLPEPCGDARSDLGVLLVHGIGDQHEGETLLSFGEPLLEYVRRTVTRAESSRLDYVQVSDAMLLPSRRLDTRTAWASVNLRVPLEQLSDDGAPFSGLEHQRQKWLVTEAWWGEQVLAPAPLTLIGWLMTRGPWVALAHILARTYKKITPASLPRWIARQPLLALLFKQSKEGHSFASVVWSLLLFICGVVFVWIPLTAVMQLGLLVLAAMALVPIPRIGRLISAFLLRVSGVLGDSYVLVQHEAQRAAIVSRTRQALGELRSLCSRIAIVAHSQGTAVVYDALRSGAPRPDLLLTFGSGLAKLEMLRIGERLRRSSLTATGWVVPLAFAALLIWVRHYSDPDLTAGMPQWVVAIKDQLAGGPKKTIQLAMLPTFALAFSALLCLAFGIGSILSASRILERQRRGEAQDDEALAKRWIDVSASHDPVPSAPLSTSLARPDIEFVGVINRSSFVADHTSYFENRAEFVPLVAQALCDASGLRLAGPQHADELTKARRHHIASVHVLGWTRIACAVSLPVIGVLFWERLREGGQLWLDDLTQTLPGKYVDVQATLNSVLPWGRAIFGSGFDEKAAVALLTLLAGGVAIWLWRHAYGPLWRWWDRVLIDDALNGTKSLGKAGVAITAPIVVLLGMLPLVLAALALNGIAIEGAILSTFGWLFVALVLFCLVILGIGMITVAFQLRREIFAHCRRFADHGTDPRQSWSWFAGLLGVASLLVWVAVSPPDGRDASIAEYIQALAKLFPCALVGAVVLLTVRLARFLRQSGARPARWPVVGAPVLAAWALQACSTAPDLIRTPTSLALVALLCAIAAYAYVSRTTPS